MVILGGGVKVGHRQSCNISKHRQEYEKIAIHCNHCRNALLIILRPPEGVGPENDLTCWLEPEEHLPQVEAQKLPAVMKDSLHLPNCFCWAQE